MLNTVYFAAMDREPEFRPPGQASGEVAGEDVTFSARMV
jgi:hypothetical protein